MVNHGCEVDEEDLDGCVIDRELSKPVLSNKAWQNTREEERLRPSKTILIKTPGGRGGDLYEPFEIASQLDRIQMVGNLLTGVGQDDVLPSKELVEVEVETASGVRFVLQDRTVAAVQTGAAFDVVVVRTSSVAEGGLPKLLLREAKEH